MHDHYEFVESLEGWNPRRDRILSTRPQAYAFAFTAEEDLNHRFSAYERGVVSVLNEFSFSGGQFGPQRPVRWAGCVLRRE